MAIAKKIQEVRLETGVQAIYELDQPVRDMDGDETLFVAVSAIKEHPQKGTPETIAVCLFPCPEHGYHMGRFTPVLENDLTCDEYSHAAVLDKLGYTIVDELATLD